METLRVLVVDDELGMRHSVARALRNHRITLREVEGEVGFTVDAAESGEQALEMLAAQSYDLMLLDHKMGGMSGIDVLEALRNDERDMLIIMITAFATIETAVRATKTGAFDFIAKPFTPDELKETIRKAAGHLLVQREVRRLAEEKKRVRFDFIRVLGHELKSPLAAITSYMELMRDRLAGEELKDYDSAVQRCLVRAEGMRKLIADLLDMTRIESGEKQRTIGAVDVAEVAQAVLDGQRLNAEARDVTLAFEASGDTKLQGDRGEIEIVLNNLVSNAVKYNREHGRVDVRLAGNDTEIRIEVQDTGIGLSADEAAKLFSDFTRIRNEKTRDIEGSGLGLSIVKKIAGLYDGTACVKSTPDVGSTFCVTLQRQSQTQPAEETA